MLDKFLSLSDKLRPKFSASLGASNEVQANSILINGKPLPLFLREIYLRVEGTRSGITEQSLMDFLPGYRLIHAQELVSNFETCSKIEGSGNYLPFLANYSSDFICWKDGEIFEFAHDRPSPCLVHKTEASFFDTICDFYAKGVYFLDEHGYLDYDFDQERIVGTSINPGITYWQEG